MADDFEQGGSKLYASLARSVADEPVVEALVGEHEPKWEAPLRLFGGVHYLELSGMVQHPWAKLRGVLEANLEWLARFVAEQPIQTNEVQRCWGLLPAFLTVAEGRRLDLIELGPSGGLNLYWDRYAYTYGDERWGDRSAGLVLSGRAEGGPPPDLLRAEVEVASRIGIDRRPVDVATDHGARLLEAFVWADQTDRLDRVRRAIEIAREDPPRLLDGDYVELLPALLAERDLDSLTVVYHSVMWQYPPQSTRDAVTHAIHSAAAHADDMHRVAWLRYEPNGILGTPGPMEEMAVDLQVWPGAERRVLVQTDGHARWVVAL